ncbi:MAG: PaaI family thioesterase [Myxococcales bacterium]
MRKLMSVASPHMRELGMEFLDLKDGVAVARIPYKHELVGDPVTGVLHGGVVTTLLDSTGGAAVFSRLKAPAPIATLDLRIDYLRGSTPNEPLYSRVECYKITRQVGFTRGIAHNGDESDPVASMSGTFMLNTTAVRVSGKEGGR